jgi:hypothetical protein
MFLGLFFGIVSHVADLFHPVNDLTVGIFLKGDIRHGCRGSSTVPGLYPRPKPHHVAELEFLNRTALTRHPAATSGHEKDLTQRMRVPRRARTGFEGDTGTGRACWPRELFGALPAASTLRHVGLERFGVGGELRFRVSEV